jgi:hypothetical protein
MLTSKFLFRVKTLKRLFLSLEIACKFNTFSLYTKEIVKKNAFFSKKSTFFLKKLPLYAYNSRKSSTFVLENS